MTLSPARSAASRALARVFRDGAFASAALDAELARVSDARDHALATELVYGVLRTEGFLVDAIRACSKNDRALADPVIRAHLTMGAYAIAFLDRVPVFAAVSEAVSGVRASGEERAAGYANAVLRKLATSIEEKGRPSLASAIAASAPGWLRGALRKSLGRSAVDAYLTAGPVPPPIGLCLAETIDRAAEIEALRAQRPGSTFEEGRVSPRAILVRGAGDVRTLDGLGARFIVQEEGAQIVALAAGVRPGDRVLDACAGHGNKTWLFAEQGGVVDAADVHADKLKELRGGPAGARVNATFTVDWTAGTGDVREGFYDRVIVDAPCSGVGTLRRRPEIARSKAAEDVTRLAAIQAAIVRRAATCAKLGGVVLYAVCSVLREEAESVVEAVMASPFEGGLKLVPSPFDTEPMKGLSSGGSMLRLLPHVHGTDGYFVASLRVERAI